MIRTIGISTLLLFAYVVGFTQKGKDFITEEYNAGRFNGAVLIEKNGKEVLNTCKGYANLQFSIPIDPSTRFPIASMTKTFTAILILQLYEKGQLQLTDKTGKYIDSLPAGCEGITIHDLLTHHSGLKNEPVQAYTSKYSARDWIKRYAIKKDTANHPAFNYNNADYILLTCLIETLTGKKFATVLKENILTPLGMANTGVIREDIVIPSLAYGYHNYSFGSGKKGDPVYNDAPIYLSNYAGAGAIYSTTSDLLKLVHGLRDHKLLTAKTTSDFLTNARENYFLDFGRGCPTIGFYLDDKTFSVPVLDRNGSINGFNTRLIIDKDFKRVVIILANTDTGDLEKIGDELFRSVL